MMIPGLLTAPQWVLFVALVAATFYADWKHRRVFDSITYSALAAGLLVAAVWSVFIVQPPNPWWMPLTKSLAGAIFGFGIMYLLYVMGGVGGGDVKLMAAAGAVVGFPFIVEVLMYSTLVGLAVGLCAVIWAGKFKVLVRRTFSPKGLLRGQKLEESVQLVPFGMAFAGGSIWACLMYLQ